MKHWRLALAALLIAGFAGLGIHNIVANQNSLKLKDVQLKSTTTDLKNLELRYDILNKNLDKELHEKTLNQDRVKQLEQEKQELEQKKIELEQQLGAKKEAARVAAAQLNNAASFTATAYAAASVVSGCGDNSMANYIYMHESGCNLNAVNAGGCRGIGQACPGSKLPCGADYACQNAWFTNYANQRYGGWQGAYNFWLANHWW
jgi:hypothetical protein